VARVAERARRGGHSVPPEVVRRRFSAGLSNFFALYRRVVDTWQMFDNSTVDEPRLLARGRAGQPDEILNADAWENLSRRSR